MTAPKPITIVEIILLIVVIAGGGWWVLKKKFTPMPVDVIVTPFNRSPAPTSTLLPFSLDYPETFHVQKTDAGIGYLPLFCDDLTLLCLIRTLKTETSNGVQGYGIRVQKIPDVDEYLCSGYPDVPEGFQRLRRTIGGVDWYGFISSEAATGGNYEVDHTYRTFYRNNCYEVTLQVDSNNGSAVDRVTPAYTYATKEREDRLLQKLEDIFSTFRFTN